MFGRFGLIVRAKFNALLNRVEDPRQSMELATDEYQALLYNARKALANYVTEKKKLELRRASKQQLVAELTEKAGIAVDQGRDDLAEAALQEKLIHENSVLALDTQITALNTDQVAAERGINVLEAQIERFADEKSMFNAKYTAAESRAELAEAFTGIGDSMSSLGSILGRAQAQLEDKEAFGLAVGELVENGALRDLTQLGSGSPVMRELDQIAGQSRVTAELEALKAERKQIAAPKTRKVKATA